VKRWYWNRGRDPLDHCGLIPMRNQESEIGFLGATAGLPSSALYHLFERALVCPVAIASPYVRRVKILRDHVIARSETTKQSRFPLSWRLLRFVRNDMFGGKPLPPETEWLPAPCISSCAQTQNGYHDR